MGQGLANTMRAVKEGITWVDGTVTGMGRGPGNAKTEYLTIELEQYRNTPSNPTKLFSVINKYFKPMQVKYEWGPNPFYYLAGKYGIHPTYIQSMIGDNRYSEEDILVVIDYLRKEGGKKFRLADMEAARHFYSDKPNGTWVPADLIASREVLILGTGPGVVTHQRAIEEFIKSRKPFVIALNTQTSVASELIDIRAACHPVRLLADHYEHAKLPQPLVIPASQLSDSGLSPLSNKELFDFGLQVQEKTFAFKEKHCILPSSLVVAYALAIATSGKATRIFLAGFDGYGAEDPRNVEMDAIMDLYIKNKDAVPVVTITPSKYKIPKSSIYGLL
jgi:4-hydroxy 2-oxovalerate aldolase